MNIRNVLFAAVALAVSQSAAASPNLIANGDFSLGNTAFSSQYSADVYAYSEGTFVVGNDPHLAHSGAISFGDHTTGNGLMMLVNGTVQPNRTVWQEVLAVTTNTQYDFQGWITTWGRLGGPNVDPSPPVLQLLVNGVQVGADFNVDPANGQWSLFSATWSSANSTFATLSILDTNTQPVGNDFALDDLSFTAAVPEPDTYAMFIAGLGIMGLVVRRRRNNNT